jgi:nucleotide-binding universal stress UspA family protein
MHRFRRVLVGLDLDPSLETLGPGGLQAAEQALWLARQTGAAVTLFHSTLHEERDVELGARGRAALEALRGAHQEQGVSGELQLSDADPALEMIRMVLRDEADLVIVGKRGAAHRDDGSLGRVPSALLSQCPGPVWLAHPGRHVPPRLVLGATDLTAVGSRATEIAASLAVLCGAGLEVVYAYQLPFELQLECGRIPDAEFVARVRAIEDDARERIASDLAAAGTGLDPGIQVTCTSPIRAILGGVATSDPDLLVMGTVSRWGIAKRLVGSTAERVLARVDCSLLTVKPEEFISPVSLG